jgi:WD40 repeat protein
LKKASYEELRRIVREEEPPKPSTRLSTLGQAATAVAAKRQNEPHRLSQLFRGELDWIVMKALEKDRNRRYDTVSSLAADAERYLHDEPVQACPPSAVYRFRKFARRNRGALTTAGVLAFAVLLTVAGLGASTVLTLQAKDELQQTLERERQNSYFQRIALAEREWSANNVRGWKQLLASCPPDLRGWEYRYLSRLGREKVVMHHGAAVFGLAIRPDGEQLASCSQDGSVKIWDATTSRQLRAIPAHANHARSIAFSPDSQRLASASWDGTVKVWDARTGRKLHDLRGHQGEVWSVTFSPDSKHLASGGGKHSQLGEVIIWDAAAGQAVRTLNGHTSSVYSVMFSPNGKRLASGGTDGMVKLWDAATGQEQLSLPGQDYQDYQVFGVAFSPDGRLLVSCGGARTLWGDGQLKVWDADTGKKLFDLRGHTRGVWAVAFSPDGHRLASGSADQTVKLWDVATGEEALTLRDHNGPIRGLVFSPDGHRLFSCSHDETVRVWNATRLGPAEDDGCLTLRGHSDEVTSVAFNPKEPAVVGSASVDGTIKLWNARTGKTLLNLRDPNGSVYGLAFSPDARLLATVGQEKNVKLWDTKTGNRINTLSAHGTGDLSVAFLPGGRLLASTGWEKLVRVWDLETGKPIYTLSGHSWVVESVACSPNGKLVVSGGADGTVRLWDVENGQEVPTSPLRTDAPVSCVTFSGDGEQLAAACSDRSVKIWDTTTWKLLHCPTTPRAVRRASHWPAWPARRLGRYRFNRESLGSRHGRDPCPARPYQLGARSGVQPRRGAHCLGQRGRDRQDLESAAARGIH